MTYPSDLTFSNLNLKDLNSVIKWTQYLAQALAAVRFLAMKNATATRDYNNADSLASAPPFLKGATLSRTSVNTTLVSEPFQKFGDICEMDYSDIQNARGVNQLEQQTRSIEARILRELNKQFFEGNGVAPNLLGISSRADTTIGVGGPITLPFLYQARYAINPSCENGLGWGGNAWFSNEIAFRKVLELFGNHSSQIEWKTHPLLSIQIPFMLGMPWFIDENIPVAGSRTTIYAVNLNHLRIFYATHPDYCANEYGLIRIPIPSQASVSEFGELVLGIYAIQKDPCAIVRLTTISV